MGDSRRKLDNGGGAFGHNPFANLGKQLFPDLPDNASEGPASPDSKPKKVQDTRPDSGPEALHGRRIVLHRRRKGQAGKPALQVSGVGGDAAQLRELAREMARALGMGARADGEHIMVPGQDVDRLERWLLERGAAEVVRP